MQYAVSWRLKADCSGAYSRRGNGGSDWKSQERAGQHQNRTWGQEKPDVTWHQTEQIRPGTLEDNHYLGKAEGSTTIWSLTLGELPSSTLFHLKSDTDWFPRWRREFSGHSCRPSFPAREEFKDVGRDSSGTGGSGREDTDDSAGDHYSFRQM